MSTDPQADTAAAEDPAAPEADPSAAAEASPEPEPAAEAEPEAAAGPGPDADPAAGSGDGDAADSAAAGGGGDTAEPAAEAPAAPALSEAQAELAAQKIERERIARRKAEREAPVEAGAKLSGTAADLLAAVRAVESGAKPSAVYFDEAPAAPRRAPAPAAAPPA
ncbi:hypothetical protein ADK75_04225, partial [Streptomyces virginiae]